MLQIITMYAENGGNIDWGVMSKLEGMQEKIDTAYLTHTL